MKLHDRLSDLVDEIRAGNRDLPAPAAELVLEMAGAVDALSERVAELEAAASASVEIATATTEVPAPSTASTAPRASRTARS